MPIIEERERDRERERERENVCVCDSKQKIFFFLIHLKCFILTFRIECACKHILSGPLETKLQDGPSAFQRLGCVRKGETCCI